LLSLPDDKNPSPWVTGRVYLVYLDGPSVGGILIAAKPGKLVFKNAEVQAGASSEFFKRMHSEPLSSNIIAIVDKRAVVAAVDVSLGKRSRR